MDFSNHNFKEGIIWKEMLLSTTCFFLLVVASFGVLLSGQAATDTYFSLYYGDSVNWSGWMTLGRFTAVLFKQILVALKLNTMDPTVQTVSLMIMTVVSMEWIFVSFRPLFEGKLNIVFLGTCVALAYINPFYAEWFLFPECYFMFGLSAVLCGAYEEKIMG